MSTPATVNPVVALMRRVGIEDEKIVELFKQLLPEARGLDSFEQVLTAFAHRAAANGFTADQAQAFATGLSSFASGVPDNYAQLVGDIADHFHAGAVTKTEAARFARQVYAAIEGAKTVPAPTAAVVAQPSITPAPPVVEGTAVAVPDEGPLPDTVNA